MVKINKKTEYALIVLKFMMERPEGELATAREICNRFNTPFDTTAKVMQQMNNAEILGSIKGVKGGYYLTKDLAKISYLELAELIEGKTLSMDCEGLNCSLLSSCNITGPIKRLNQYLNLFFRELSIEELLKDDVSLTQLVTNKEIAP